jgi:hypothetical protein
MTLKGYLSFLSLQAIWILPLWGADDFGKIHVKQNYPDGVLEYTIGPDFLDVKTIPRHSCLEKRREFFQPRGRIEARKYVCCDGKSCYHPPISIRGSDVSHRRIVLKSGEIIMLWDLAQSLRLSQDQKMVWDLSSEENFLVHLDFFKAQPQELRIPILEVSRWEKGPLMDHQLTKIIERLSQNEISLGLKLLLAQIQGAQDKTANDLLKLIPGNIQDSSSIEFIVKKSDSPLQERLAYLHTLSNADFYYALRILSFTQEELDQIKEIDLKIFQDRISSLDERQQTALITEFFSKIPMGVTVSMLTKLGDFNKLECVKQLLYPLVGTKDELLECLMKTSETYRVGLIRNHILKGHTVSRDRLIWIFKKTHDSYKSCLILAGIFDGFVMDDTLRLDLIYLSSGSTAWGEILKALQIRYPR